jgi:hypothetical protein
MKFSVVAPVIRSHSNGVNKAAHLICVLNNELERNKKQGKPEFLKLAGQRVIYCPN